VRPTNQPPSGEALLLAAALSGDAGAGVPPPHATTAPIDTIAARSAKIAMLFMIVFLLQRSRSTGTERTLHQLRLSRQLPTSRLMPNPLAARAGTWATVVGEGLSELTTY
jgi:hypothetical protein